MSPQDAASLFAPCNISTPCRITGERHLFSFLAYPCTFVADNSLAAERAGHWEFDHGYRFLFHLTEQRIIVEPYECSALEGWFHKVVREIEQATCLTSPGTPPTAASGSLPYSAIGAVQVIPQSQHEYVQLTFSCGGMPSVTMHVVGANHSSVADGCPKEFVNCLLPLVDCNSSRADQERSLSQWEAKLLGQANKVADGKTRLAQTKAESLSVKNFGAGCLVPAILYTTLFAFASCFGKEPAFFQGLFAVSLFLTIAFIAMAISEKRKNRIALEQFQQAKTERIAAAEVALTEATTQCLQALDEILLAVPTLSRAEVTDTGTQTLSLVRIIAHLHSLKPRGVNARLTLPGTALFFDDSLRVFLDGQLLVERCMFSQGFSLEAAMSIGTHVFQFESAKCSPTLLAVHVLIERAGACLVTFTPEWQGTEVTRLTARVDYRYN